MGVKDGRSDFAADLAMRADCGVAANLRTHVYFGSFADCKRTPNDCAFVNGRVAAEVYRTALGIDDGRPYGDTLLYEEVFSAVYRSVGVVYGMRLSAAGNQGYVGLYLRRIFLENFPGLADEYESVSIGYRSPGRKYGPGHVFRARRENGIAGNQRLLRFEPADRLQQIVVRTKGSVNEQVIRAGLEGKLMLQIRFGEE